MRGERSCLVTVSNVSSQPHNPHKALFRATAQQFFSVANTPACCTSLDAPAHRTTVGNNSANHGSSYSRTCYSSSRLEGRAQGGVYCCCCRSPAGVFCRNLSWGGGGIACLQNVAYNRSAALLKAAEVASTTSLRYTCHTLLYPAAFLCCCCCFWRHCAYAGCPRHAVE